MNKVKDKIMTSRVPILVTILGATGTGKSKLAIQLAQKYVGEIISADSMQVYKGLNVITAKVTKEEQDMAPHHMLDIIDPLSTFTVVDFRNRALPIIDKLFTDKKMPIIVGGTNYYIESLLWQVLVEDPKDIKDDDVSSSFSCNSLVFERDGGYVKIIDNSDVDKSLNDTSESKNKIKTNINININECSNNDLNLNQSILKISNDNNTVGDTVNNLKNDKIIIENDHINSDEYQPKFKKIKFDDPISNDELHSKLNDIDPEMAARLHPNDRRKIIRSLQVFEQRGTKHSEILRDQRLAAGGSGLGGPLRYENSVILWLQCDQEALDKRLNSRVDSMLELGLVQELLDFHDRYNQERIKSNALPDYTKGIFQSIGFKEFHDYLILDKDERDTEKGKKLLNDGIENLKLRTRRYARKQHRWVTNRLIRRFDRQVPSVYSLDTTDVSKWDENVLEPAISIINDKLSGKIPSRKSLNNNKTEDGLSFDSGNEKSNFCETCERIFIGEHQWKAHLNGRKHEKMVKRRKTDQQSKNNK